MSCVCVLTPVIAATWTQFGAAVRAAAASLGYTVDEARGSATSATRADSPSLELEIAKSQVTAGRVTAGHCLVAVKDGVTITVTRDSRGRAACHVTGRRHSRTVLEERGTEFCQRIVQRWVYQRLMEEIQARRFTVVEETVEANQAIRLKVRHWES